MASVSIPPYPTSFQLRFAHRDAGSSSMFVKIRSRPSIRRIRLVCAGGAEGVSPDSFAGWSGSDNEVGGDDLKKKKKKSDRFGGVSSDLVEDPKFVPLNADDPVYGPPALLLMGFEADEMDKILKFLKELDGEFLKIIHCTEDMVSQSIWDAMHTDQPSLQDVKIAKSLPRICFMSGLSGEEMMMFIDAFPETGLKPVVFAALVPNSADKLLIEVAEEIIGDHEMMSAKEPR